MRLNGSRTYYRPVPPKMPPGLVELMEGLTREVLKNNPTDVYAFCAGHVQHLLEVRDGPLHTKTISIEEKQKRALQKVRQRAEKRRQQYDNIKEQKSSNDNVTAHVEESIKGNTPIPLQDTINLLNNPIHNEHQLMNSSQVEIARESLSGVENEASTKEVQSENDDNDPMKNINNNVIIEVTQHDQDDHENEKEVLESSAQINSASNDLMTLSIPLHNLPESPNTKSDKLINDDLNSNIPILVPVKQEEKIEEINTIETESDSRLTNNQEILKIETANITKADNESESPVVDIKINIINENDEHLVLKKEDNTENMEISEQLNTQDDSKIINEIKNQPHDVEMAQNVVNVIEDTKESNTINFSYKESPTSELQGPVIQSDMLESLPGTDTDSDIATLITQESNFEFNHSDHIKHDSSKNESDIVDRENTESMMTITSDEELHDNLQELKTIEDNNMDDENTLDITKVLDKNDSVVDEKNISSKPQISNQDSTNMDLETAAITIQKVFRTFLFKSRASTFDDAVNDETVFLDDDDKNKVFYWLHNINLTLSRRP